MAYDLGGCVESSISTFALHSQTLFISRKKKTHDQSKGHKNQNLPQKPQTVFS